MSVEIRKWDLIKRLPASFALPESSAITQSAKTGASCGTVISKLPSSATVYRPTSPNSVTTTTSSQWFLQIECFDPHEPYYSQEHYKALYPHEYTGRHFDWPDYAKVSQTSEEVEHIRFEYAALLSMCDHYLGKVIEAFDRYDLWKDTLLIVNTDHRVGKVDFRVHEAVRRKEIELRDDAIFQLGPG
jgi:hypothetical protein